MILSKALVNGRERGTYNVYTMVVCKHCKCAGVYPLNQRSCNKVKRAKDQTRLSEASVNGGERGTYNVYAMVVCQHCKCTSVRRKGPEIRRDRPPPED